MIVSETPPPQPGYVELEKCEHPRLLFRRHHIPELRKRASTEWGARILQAIRKRLAVEPDEREDTIDRALGHGFLYSVFDEKEHGEKAAQYVRKRIWNLPGGGGHAHDVARGLLALALAYDLAYDRLTPRDLDLLSKQFSTAGGIVNQRKGLSGNWNNGPNSNWTAIGTGGAGVAMLAILRERGRLGIAAPAPCTPAEQFETADSDDAAFLGRSANNREPTSPSQSRSAVPVWDFQPNMLITNWLYSGAITPGRSSLH